MRRLLMVASMALTTLFAVLVSPKAAHAQLLSPENPNAVAYYYSLPDTVRYKLESRGVNFQVNSGAVAYETGSSRTLGVTSTTYTPGPNTIVSQAVYVKSGEEHSIIHEAGHCMESYNQIFKYWTANECWQIIYQTEVGNALAAGMSRANIYNASEYFAEAFRVYLENPVGLQTYCPQTFQYVQAVILAP